MLPNTYRRLTYIQSTGTQYINTGYAPRQSFRADIEYAKTTTGTNDDVLLGITNNNTTSFRTEIYVNSSNKVTCWNSVNGNWSMTQALSIDQRTTLSFVQTSSLQTMTDDRETMTNSVSTANTSYCYIFSYYGSTRVYGKYRLYSCKLYNDSTLVRDFIPAMRLSDGVVGLYDDVNGTFYTNAGSGSFGYDIDCNVTTEANPNGAGTITGDGTYSDGDNVTITATDNDGYVFINYNRTEAEHRLLKGYAYDSSNLNVYGATRNWTQVTFNEPTVITKYQGRNATDNYSRTWDMTIKGSNDGTNYITIQTDSFPVNSFKYVEIANPQPYKYYRWYFSRYNNTYDTGRYIWYNFAMDGYRDITTRDNPYSFTADDDTNVTAYFNRLYTITLNYDQSLGLATYSWQMDYTQILLSATPYNDAQFLGWYINSSKVSGSTSFIYQPVGDVTIEARFEPIYVVTTSVNGNGAIQFTRGTDQNDITVSVIPDANWHFVKYTVDGTDTTATPLQLHLTQDISITAYFEEDDKFHISCPTGHDNMSVYISDNDVYSGTQVTLWARPFPDYSFVKWGDNITANPRTITVTENVTLSAIYQRITDTNGIYQYRCFVKDQLHMTDPPKSFMVVDTFDINTDLLTNATSKITVIETPTNVNEGDVLVLYDPKGTFLYNGVITSFSDKTINCSQMQSYYRGSWVYQTSSKTYLEQEIATILGDYAQGKMKGSSYTDTLVAQRLGGITIDYVGSITSHLPTHYDAKSDGSQYEVIDMEEFIYELYQRYSIIFDFEINFSGTNYVHIKVPTYQKIAVGNNMYAVQDMSPVTEVEETNRLIIYSSNNTYRTTYVATKTGIVQAPSSTANRFNVTNTEIVFSDDALADLVSANLPNTMYNHKVTFNLVIKNFLYEFGEFNLGGELDVYYNDDYYSTVLTGYRISKASNQNITGATFTCGKVRYALTKMLTMGVI